MHSSDFSIRISTMEPGPRSRCYVHGAKNRAHPTSVSRTSPRRMTSTAATVSISSAPEASTTSAVGAIFPSDAQVYARNFLNVAELSGAWPEMMQFGAACACAREGAKARACWRAATNNKKDKEGQCARSVRVRGPHELTQRG